jgi:translation initiation factor 3 subunit D
LNYDQNQANQKSNGQKKVLKNTLNRAKISKARYIPSTQIKSEWKVESQMTFQQLSKLQTSLPTVSDVKQVGKLKQFDTSYETLTLKNAIQVDSSLQKSLYKTTSTQEDEEFCSTKDCDVYITDSILSKIMAATKSVYSWDVVIENKNGVLYFDRREGSKVDDFTVDETAKEQPEESRTLLSREATYLNQICVQNVVKQNKVLDVATGEEETSNGDATIAYKYRKFTLNDMSVLVRCQVDGYSVKQEGKVQLLSIKTFTERNPGLYKDDFRSTLDVNPGFVLINQHRSNACKSTRWAIEAMLSNVDNIRFLFASRTYAQTLKKHQILGLQSYNPRSYATQTVICA